MEEYNLGQVAVVSRGEYSPTAAYLPLNTVSNLGGSFMCVAQCSGIEPGVTSGWQNYWQAMARGMSGYAVSVSGSTATATVTFTDGSTYSFSYSTATIGAGAVGTQQLAEGSVTSQKIANGAVGPAQLSPSLTYAAVNLSEDQVRAIYVQSAVPTGSSPDGIYLVTGG